MNDRAPCPQNPELGLVLVSPVMSADAQRLLVFDAAIAKLLRTHQWVFRQLAR